jgi:ElaB/YqjD/DUF883 family membrane-anchored ribosome-binding protein
MATDKSSADEMKDIRADLQALRKDVEALTSTLKGEGADKIAELRESVRSTFHDKAESARAGARAMGDHMSDRGHQVKEAAEEHPFTTAVVALCVGLVTGAMISGRR